MTQEVAIRIKAQTEGESKIAKLAAEIEGLAKLSGDVISADAAGVKFKESLKQQALAAEDAAHSLSNYKDAATLTAGEVSRLSDVERGAYAERLQKVREYHVAAIRAALASTEIGRKTVHSAEESANALARLRDGMKVVRDVMTGGFTDIQAATESATQGLVSGFNVALVKAEEKVHGAAAAVQALGALLSGADLSTPVGISGLVAALDQVAVHAGLTGQQIETALIARLQKLSGQELLNLQVTAGAAFMTVGAESENAGRLMEATLNVAMKKLGLDLNEVRTGFSATFNEAAAVLTLVTENVKATGIELVAAFEAAGKAARTEGDFAELAARIREAGESARLTKDEVEKLLDGIQEKSDAATEGINSVTEAFKTLGMRSPEELRKVADTAKEAFETIRNAGTAAPRQIEEAFLKYAEAAIAANGGVASGMLKAEASARGLVVNTTDAGDKIVRAAGATKGLSEGIDKATGAAGELADKMKEDDKWAKDAAGNIVKVASGPGSWKEWAAGDLSDMISAGEAKRAWRDPKTGASMGVSPEMLEAAQSELERRRGAAASENERESSRLEQLRQESKTAIQAPLPQLPEKAPTPTPTPKATPEGPQQTIRLEFALPGGAPVALNATNNADVTRLLDVLRRAGLRVGRTA